MEPIDLIKKHCKFTSEFDVYILFGVARKKDNEGITNSQEVVFREIIKDEENIEKKYTKLKTQCKTHRTVDGKKLNFYIYLSVNARDVRKGYITFKTDMIKYEREILFGVGCHNQLKRVDSIWISAIMKPESRSKENRKFLVDIDTKDEKVLQKIGNCLNKVIPIPNLLKQETKNGVHYVLDVFDIKKFQDLIIKEQKQDICEVKTDALLFVEHIHI